MNNSFYIGVIGSKTQLQGITVASNNIANINSYGFKADRPEFKTIFETELSNNYFDMTSNDLNAGAVMQTTSTDLRSGSYVNTDKDFDLAIAGDGWFGISNGERVYFTRAGTFMKDMDSYLVDSEGNYVMGTSGDNINGKLVTPIEAIEMKNVSEQTKIKLPPDLVLPPKPTLNVILKGNLDPTIHKKFDPDTGEEIEIPNEEHFSTVIIGPEGEKQHLKMTFIKEVPQKPTGVVWNVKVEIIDGNEVKASEEGKLVFNETGALIKSEISDISNGFQRLHIDVGSIFDGSALGKGYDGLVSFAGINKEKSITRDGYAKGYLQNYEINEKGEIIAVFDNAQSVPIARVAIYHFRNDEGLEKVTPTVFQATINSGEPIFLKNENGEFVEESKILSRTLETSNVSLSEALTHLIVMQKAFDASAKSITTSDQMIQKAINMKK